MCTCEWIGYICGHEEKRRYTACTTLSEIRNSSECPCGSINFTVIRSPRHCGKTGCLYIECMMKGWTCCKCKKGPNEGHVCKQDAKPWRWDYFECGHGYCPDCRPWREKQKQNDGRGDGNVGMNGGPGPVRKGSKKRIRQSLDMITRRAEKV